MPQSFAIRLQNISRLQFLLWGAGEIRIGDVSSTRRATLTTGSKLDMVPDRPSPSGKESYWNRQCVQRKKQINPPGWKLWTGLR